MRGQWLASLENRHLLHAIHDLATFEKCPPHTHPKIRHTAKGTSPSYANPSYLDLGLPDMASQIRSSGSNSTDQAVTCSVIRVTCFKGNVVSSNFLMVIRTSSNSALCNLSLSFTLVFHIRLHFELFQFYNLRSSEYILREESNIKK